MDSGSGRTSIVKSPIVRRTRRRQVHIWLSDREFEWIQGLAAERDQKVSEAIRTLLVSFRQSVQRTARSNEYLSTAHVPDEYPKR
jgi:hypothetical protein